jgi:hypothetical protein
LQIVAAHLFHLQIVAALHLGAEVIHNFGRFVRAHRLFSKPSPGDASWKAVNRRKNTKTHEQQQQQQRRTTRVSTHTQRQASTLPRNELHMLMVIMFGYILDYLFHTYHLLDDCLWQHFYI